MSSLWSLRNSNIVGMSCQSRHYVLTYILNSTDQGQPVDNDDNDPRIDNAGPAAASSAAAG